jgi:putative copper export protein
MSLLGRGLLYLSLTGLLGASAIGFVLLRSRDPGVRLTRWSVLMGVLGLVALALLGAGQFAAFRDPFAPWREDLGLLLSTDWGRTWLLALGGFVLVVAGALWLGARRTVLFLPLVLALYPPFSGHAAASGDWTVAAILADWAHVVAAGFWLGALAGLLYLGRDASEPPLVQALGRFSVQARLSLAALVLTGGFASWLHLPGPRALLETTWGRLLSVKLVLVGATMALGAYNWRRLSPRVGEPGGAARLVRTAWGEVLVGVLVLTLTAVLASTAPSERLP